MTNNELYFNFDEFLKGADISDQNTDINTLIRKLSDNYWEYYKGSFLGSLDAEFVPFGEKQREGLMLVIETVFRLSFLLGYSECETKHNPSYKPDPNRILRKVAP